MVSSIALIAPHSVLALWAGTYFDQLCSLVHRSSRICFGLVAIGWDSLIWVPCKLDIHVLLLKLASLSIRGQSPLALTFFGGANFITWCLRHPILGECYWGSRHFWNCLVFTVKKALCQTHAYMGCKTNTSIANTNNSF